MRKFGNAFVLALVAFFNTDQVDAVEKMDLRGIATSKDAPAERLAPTKEAMFKLVDEKGFAAMVSDSTTGWKYPDDYASAVLEENYAVSVSGPEEKACARYVLTNVGRKISDFYKQPKFYSETATRAEIERAREGICAAHSEVLEAAMTLLDDINSKLPGAMEARFAREQKAEAELAAAKAEAQHRAAQEKQKKQEAEEKARKDEQMARHNERMEEQRQEREFMVARKAELKSGARKIVTYEDAGLFYDADMSQQITWQPLLKADGKFYLVAGIVEFSNDDATIVTARLPSKSDANYFRVIIRDDTTFEGRESVRLGSMIHAVGRYIANDQITLVSGAGDTAPVIEAVFVSSP